MTTEISVMYGSEKVKTGLVQMAEHVLPGICNKLSWDISLDGHIYDWALKNQIKNSFFL